MSYKHSITSLFLIATVAALYGCKAAESTSSVKTNGSSWSTQQLISESKDSALSSIRTKDRSEAKAFAKEGIEFADRCIMRAPEEAGCYYWHAVNTGLFYKIRVVGYQDGIRSMIDDCKKVISLNQLYDYAGAYRMLGQLYTQLPQTGAHADSITRDLSLGEKYLRKAIQLSPDYPENHLALAENLFTQGKFTDAIDNLASARELAPNWKDDASYANWNESALALEKKITKKTK